MFGSTKEKGLCLAMPDTCVTPMGQTSAPVAYPNIANCPQANDVSEKVFFNGAKVITKKSNFPASQGDEAGTQGGVTSGRNMGKVEYSQGSNLVKAEGAAVMRLTATTTHNQNNAVGAQIVPSQTKVLILL